jgi:hypothetical protein
LYRNKYIHRLGGEVTFTWSRKRVENWSSNFNAISLALGAVGFKEDMCSEEVRCQCRCLRVSANLLPNARADAESGLSLLAIELKRGPFGNLLQINS